MATLPRVSKYPPGTSSSFFQRPQSEFDAGLNTSAAWTEHLESSAVLGSLSDEEPDGDGEKEALRSARALYDFEGKAEFRELSVNAGDSLQVVKENLADGWSLVKNVTGEVGLLPRTYYTVRCSPSFQPTETESPEWIAYIGLYPCPRFGCGFAYYCVS